MSGEGWHQHHQNSGFVGSICDENYTAAISGVTKKLKAALDSNCMRTTLTPDPNGVTDCLIVEVLREGTDAGRSCEGVAKGLCTPGSSACRGTGISVEQAAEQLNLPIATTDADGTAVARGTQAAVANGNVYVIGQDLPAPKKHLVCEVRQLRGDELSACINTLTAPPLDGWCYSRKPELLSDICIKSGAPGMVRYLGGAATRPGSEIFTYCGLGLQTGVCGS